MGVSSGQREQAQGHELRKDGRDGEAAAGGGAKVVGPSEATDKE
jgi:hypothetical protein